MRFNILLIATILLFCLVFSSVSSAEEPKSPLKQELSRLLTLKQQLKTQWNPSRYLNARILRIAKRFRIAIPKRCKRRVIVDDEVLSTIKKLATCDKETKPELPPTKPTTPTKPTEPTTPTTPTTPSKPSRECPLRKCKRSCGNRGYKKNARGCNTCSCNPKPAEPSNPSTPTNPTTPTVPSKPTEPTKPTTPTSECPKRLTCRLMCKNGYFVDSNGCVDTCRCKPSSCPQFKCLRACPYGYKVNERGCTTCSCKPKPPCPQRRCVKHCPTGYQVNSNGCVTCTCKPATPTTPVFECPKRKCSASCPSGYKTDRRGCQTCSCIRRPVRPTPVKPTPVRPTPVRPTPVRPPVRPPVVRPPIIVRPPVRPPVVRPPVIVRPPVVRRPRRIVRVFRRFRRFGRGRGDPHYTLLNSGKDVLFNGLGDYILAETEDKEFIAHVRIAKWHKKATVNIGASVKLGSDIIEFNAKNGKFYLNKEQAEFKVGKKYELEGGFITRKSENRFVIKSVDGVELFGERFTLHDGKSYMDVSVDAPNDVEFKRGLIVNGKGRQGKGLFRKVSLVKKNRNASTVVEIPKWAKKACAKSGLTGKQLKDCAYDAAVSGKEFAKEIAKDEAKFNKKSNQVIQKAIAKK